MIYVDSCIPMYLVGAEHDNKSRVIELTPRLIEGRETLVTSVETFQEIVHRYKRLKNYTFMNLVYSALEEMVSQIHDVVKTDADGAKELAIQYTGLSSRDCLHAAVMKRLKCVKLWTFDTGFDKLPGIQRVC